MSDLVPEVDHRPTTTMGMEWACTEGDCDHDEDTPDACLFPVTVCGGCLDALPEEYEGPLPTWPCPHASDEPKGTS